MNVAGIVCEYNPVHSGHEMQIRETKRLLGEDSAVVCVMSGNFVQRGDFAVFSKHARASAAISAGADLVLENPAPWAVSSAEGFALGALSVLNSLGVCTHLSFGSEAGNVGELERVVKCLEDPKINSLIISELDKGVSYAAARQKAVASLLGEQADLLKEPNNILGIEYLKALDRLSSRMEPMTIKRIGAGHDGDQIRQGIASATKLRQMISSGEDIRGYIPKRAAEIFEEEILAGRAPVFMKSCETAVLAKLRGMTKEEYEALPFGSEGLYMRLMRYAKTRPSIDAVIESTKTKRYAASRIRRMILCAYLGIRKEDVLNTPPYIRVLAFNKTGQKLLREIKEKALLPVITKPASARGLEESAKRIFEIEAAATDLYALAYPRVSQRCGGGEWTTGPVVMKI